MATFYLKNTSGSKKTIGDLGILLANNQSTIIDSNNVDGYLSAEMQAALLAGSSGGVVLSTTDIGDTSGDMTPQTAIDALSVTTFAHVNNPHKTTFLQTVTQQGGSDVTLTELERLTNDSDVSSSPELHNHDTRYWTKTQVEASNPGTVKIHWDNITNAPSFGSLSWQASALVRVLGISSDASTETWTVSVGSFYINSLNKHIYRYDGTNWIDYRTPVHGDRVLNLTNNHIYSYDQPTSSWVDFATPEDNWALMIDDDGDSKAAQYIYDAATSKWLKIADVDWGDHQSLGNRDATGAHPATAISYSNSTSGLSSTSVQEAIDELSIENGTEISNILYVAKNGTDTPPSPATIANLGSISLPYLTIQTAINSITSATSTNRYAVFVAPGDYEESVLLTKPYVYLVGIDRNSTRIKTTSGNTLTLSNSTENVNGVYDITIESTSTSTDDSTVLITGNNQELKDVIINSPNGARAIYVNGAYTQNIQHATIYGGEIRVDVGVVNLHSVISTGSLNITGGTTRVVDCTFANTSSDAVVQDGGTVYFVSGKLISGSGKLDYKQNSGTVYIGWVDYTSSKLSFSGTRNTLFKSTDLFYDNSSSGLNSIQVQSAIDELVSRTSSQLTKYIVGKDSFDKYSSIQSAISAAIADGHNSANPCIVIVKPGEYTENISLSEGINIISLSSTNPELTKVSGSITFTSSVDSGISSIYGLLLNGSSSSLIVNGTKIQQLNVNDCKFTNSSTYPTISIDGVSSSVYVKDSDIINSSTGRAVDLVNGFLELIDSSILSTENSFGSDNSSTFAIETTNIGSSIVIGGTSSGTIKNSTINNGTETAIAINSTLKTNLIDTIAFGTGSLSGGTYPENLVIRKNASDVPYDPTLSGLSSENVQDAISELAKEYNVELDNIVYVAKNGSDSTLGVKLGSLSNPYLTVQAAINSITDASSSKYYIVFVMPGTYNENIQFKPWIGLVGNYKEGTSIKGSSGGTHLFNFTTGGRIFLHNVALGGSSQLLSVIHPAGAANGVSIYFDNVNLGTPTFSMLGSGVDYVQFRNDCYISGLCTVHAANLTANDSTFYSGILLDDTGSEHLDSYGTASASTVKDCMGSTLTCRGNTWSEFYNCYSWDSLTSDGSSCTVSYDVQSAPDDPTKLISLNSGNFQRTDNAYALNYNNTTSGLAATQVQAAIDELKANISSFKMPRGTSFPSSGTEDGDLYYRTDMSMPFQYDASRSKWLSMSKQTLDWGSSSADGKYLNIHGAAATQTGYLMPRKGTVVSVTVRTASGNLTKPIELRRNNGPWSATSTDYTFTPTAGSFSKTDVNIDFNAGDYIQAFAPSNGVPARDCVVMIEIAYLGA